MTMRKEKMRNPMILIKAQNQEDDATLNLLNSTMQDFKYNGPHGKEKNTSIINNRGTR